jgi:hypothetical protein
MSGLPESKDYNIEMASKTTKTHKNWKSQSVFSTKFNFQNLEKKQKNQAFLGLLIGFLIYQKKFTSFYLKLKF